MRYLLIFSLLVMSGCDDGSLSELDEVCPRIQCSDAGSCVTVELKPVCTCDEGYEGPSCGRCALLFFRDDADNCVPVQDCSAVPDLCGDNGVCSQDIGDLQCNCSAGFTGETCGACIGGYHAEDEGGCVPDQECLSTSCSAQGDCTIASGAVECDCYPGFTGEFCEHIVDDCTAASCNGHGSCDGSSGEAQCTCDTGYAGADCSTCYVGYHENGEGDCVIDELCEATSCSGGGDCGSAGGIAVCTCYAGYTGDSCESCASGFHRGATYDCVPDESCTPDPCDPVGGVCDISTGVAICECDLGHDGPDCSLCYPGYHDDGSGACVLNEQCTLNVCNGGVCEDATGAVVCSNCPSGFDGDYCENNIDNCATVNCGSGDTCIDQTNTYICLCDSGQYLWGSLCP